MKKMFAFAAMFAAVAMVACGGQQTATEAAVEAAAAEVEAAVEAAAEATEAAAEAAAEAVEAATEAAAE